MQYLLFKNQFTFAHFRLIKKGKTEDCCVLRNFKEHVDDRKLQAILLINIKQSGWLQKDLYLYWKSTSYCNDS